MKVSLDRSTSNYANNKSARKAPTVSVIIPAYKSAAYIAETLDSVFAQTFTDFEVIVINDGSPDTETLECELRPYLERLVYLKQENQGPAVARNLGIHYAQGEYLAFLDSDDSWLPEYLAEQVKLLEETPSAVMACSDTQLFGDSPFAGQTFWHIYPPKVPVTFESLLISNSAIVTSCAVARKSAIIEAGLFDRNFIGPEDFDLWLRLAHRGGEIALLRKTLGRRRIHTGALTAADVKLQADIVRVLRKLDGSLELTPRARSLLRQRLMRDQAQVDLEQGKQLLHSGNSEKARELLTNAYTFFRTKKLWVTLLGLRIAPGLTAFVARMWDRRLEHVAVSRKKVHETLRTAG
jgi:glycosyltransferase involved in cell wall biosynthesis